MGLFSKKERYNRWEWDGRNLYYDGPYEQYMQMIVIVYPVQKQDNPKLRLDLFLTGVASVLAGVAQKAWQQDPDGQRKINGLSPLLPVVDQSGKLAKEFYPQALLDYLAANLPIEFWADLIPKMAKGVTQFALANG